MPHQRTDSEDTNSQDRRVLDLGNVVVPHMEPNRPSKVRSSNRLVIATSLPQVPDPESQRNHPSPCRSERDRPKQQAKSSSIEGWGLNIQPCWNSCSGTNATKEICLSKLTEEIRFVTKSTKNRLCSVCTTTDLVSASITLDILTEITKDVLVFAGTEH